MPGMTTVRVSSGEYTPECREDGCGWIGTPTFDEAAAEREAEDHETVVHGVDQSATYADE